MLLKQLLTATGVSGHENEIRALILEEAQKCGATCRVDRMGSVIAIKDGGDTTAPTVLLDAHMDEVGLIITGVRDDGLLRIQPVGSVDPRVCVSKAVLIGDDKVPGVIGAKAIHLQTPQDRDRVLEYTQLFIDIGAKTKDEAAKKCPPGTYVAFDSPPIDLGDGFLASRALDDRVGCNALLAALAHGYRGKLICAFTVQEEVGLRGALVIGAQEDFDIAIACEGTAANDLGEEEVSKRVCVPGEGVAISAIDRTTIPHPALRQAMMDIATEQQIPWQHKRAMTGGNNSGAYQRRHGAKPVLVLSCPCRYIHSPISVLKITDAEAQANLVCAFLDHIPTKMQSIKGGQNA